MRRWQFFKTLANACAVSGSIVVLGPFNLTPGSDVSVVLRASPSARSLAECVASELLAVQYVSRPKGQKEFEGLYAELIADNAIISAMGEGGAPAIQQEQRVIPNPSSKLLSQAVVGGIGLGLPLDLEIPPGLACLMLLVPAEAIHLKSPIDLQDDLGLPWSGDGGAPMWFDEFRGDSREQD